MLYCFLELIQVDLDVIMKTKVPVDHNCDYIHVCYTS